VEDLRKDRISRLAESRCQRCLNMWSSAVIPLYIMAINPQNKILFEEGVLDCCIQAYLEGMLKSESSEKRRSSGEVTRRMAKTYNCRGSIVVIHPTTDQAHRNMLHVR
jgi:hypothetical protein